MKSTAVLLRFLRDYPDAAPNYIGDGYFLISPKDWQEIADCLDARMGVVPTEEPILGKPFPCVRVGNGRLFADMHVRNGDMHELKVIP